MNTRNQSLDVLRCIAVLLVLGVHVPYYRAWAHVGWAGVDLFFVLSGFLISGLLFRDYQAHGSIDWKRFLIRRGFKIYPSYYVALCASGIFLSFIGHQGHLRLKLFANAVFVGNYWTPALSGPFGHLWSIAVEEHFYVLLPALLVVLSRRRVVNAFACIPWLMVPVAVASLAFRLTATLPDQLKATHMRFDGLFAGVVLGYLYHFQRARFVKLANHGSLACAGMCWLGAYFAGERALSYTAIWIGAALLLAWSVDRTPQGRITKSVTRGLASVGFYSYSIYLWHFLPALIFQNLPLTVTNFWFYVAVSLALGIVMAKLIELPSLALRERYFPSREVTVQFRNQPAIELPGVEIVPAT